MDIKVVATNRKARHEYLILDSYEAGISLQGSEIKSVRAGQVSLGQAYIKIDENLQAWLLDAHIAPYEQANRNNHDPVRPRRLLLHREEINRLWNNIRQKGFTIIPLRMYLKQGRAKVEIATARGKKLYDKRADLAKRDAELEMERAFRRRD